MNETTKKKISLGYSIALIVLAAVFTFFSFMPALVFDAGEMDYEGVYYVGEFTHGADPNDEFKFGPIAVVDFIRHIGDVLKLIRHQEHTVNPSSDSHQYILDSDERARLSEKFADDESFVTAVRMYYVFGGLFDDDSDSSNDSTASKFATDSVSLTAKILAVISLVCLIGIALVFPIIIFIKFIIFLVKSLKHIKEDTDEDVDNRMDKFSFTTYSATMFMFYACYVLLSKGAEMGLAIIGALIVFLTVCILRAVKNILFASEGRLLVIVKQAITLISIVSVALLLVNFKGVDIINKYDEAITKISLAHYDAELEKLADSGKEDYQITKAAEEAVAKSNEIKSIAAIFVVFLGALVMVGAIITGIERVANKKVKLKTGEFVHHKAMLSLAVIMLIVAIVPTLLAAKSEEDLDKAYSAGWLKIWYTEYQEEGTRMYNNYERLKVVKEAGEEILEEMRDALNEADEDEKEEAQKAVEAFEKEHEKVIETINDIEAMPKRPTNCLIFAILFLLAEFAYHFVPKFMQTKKDDGSNEEPAAPEAPTEA